MEARQDILKDDPVLYNRALHTCKCKSIATFNHDLTRMLEITLQVVRQHPQDVQFALVRQEDGDLLPVKQREGVQRVQVQVGGDREGAGRNVDDLVSYES